MGLYCAVKAAIVAAGWHTGVGWEATVLHAWSEADQALWAGVLNFWFLSRTWERRDGRA